MNSYIESNSLVRIAVNNVSIGTTGYDGYYFTNVEIPTFNGQLISFFVTHPQDWHYCVATKISDTAIRVWSTVPNITFSMVFVFQPN